MSCSVWIHDIDVTERLGSGSSEVEFVVLPGPDQARVRTNPDMQLAVKRVDLGPPAGSSTNGCRSRQVPRWEWIRLQETARQISSSVPRWCRRRKNQASDSTNVIPARTTHASSESKVLSQGALNKVGCKIVT